jgi:hypothetical protein
MVRFEYIPMQREPRDARGHSETQLRKRLEQQGWRVWRGAMIGCWRSRDWDEKYPNVRRRYAELHRLLVLEHALFVEELCYLNAVHHGMPDLLCRRETIHGVEWKFVECKRKHEQLLPSQRACIPRLEGLGFVVEVHALVDHRTKRRSAQGSLSASGGPARDVQVSERQLKLTKKLCAQKNLC